MAFWTRLPASTSPDAPGGGCCHSAVYDAARNRMLLFGGGTMEYYTNETYSWCLRRRVWSRVPTTGADIPQLMSHAAVVHGNTMIVDGGLGADGSTGGTYRLCLNSLVWTELRTIGTPPPRKGHAAFVYDGAMWVVFGSDDVFGSARGVHKLDLETLTWSTVTCSGGHAGMPRSRTGHSAQVVGDRMYMFGGVTQHSTATALSLLHHHRHEEWLNDTWVLHLRSGRWTLLHDGCGVAPPGRYSHLSWMAGDGMYIFGGDADACTVYFNDVWRFDTQGHQWSALEVPGDVPSPRSGCSGIAHEGAVVVFGGETRSDGPSYSDAVFLLPHYADRGTPLFAAVARYYVSWHLDLPAKDFTQLCQRAGIPPSAVTSMLAIKPHAPDAADPGQKRRRLNAGPPLVIDPAPVFDADVHPAPQSFSQALESDRSSQVSA